MTTTRIDHTGHNHPSTTAARTACRKAMKATTPVLHPTCVVGRSTVRHLAIIADGTLVAADCGAGMGRGVRKNSPLYRQADAAASEIGCTKCAKKVS